MFPSGPDIKCVLFCFELKIYHLSHLSEPGSTPPVNIYIVVIAFHRVSGDGRVHPSLTQVLFRVITILGSPAMNE